MRKTGRTAARFFMPVRQAGTQRFVRNETQRGFSLIELLIAAGILAVVIGTFVMLLHALAARMRAFTAQTAGRSEILRLIDRWEADQSTAQAIFVPALDVLGADNGTAPHEFDFYAKDAMNRPFFWAYRWDSRSGRLQRYVYGALGAVPQADGAAIEGVSRFDVSLHRLSEIADPSSPVYLPIFANPKDYDVALDAGPGVIGGTRVVHVALATAREAEQVDLSAHAAPSGFTVILNYTPAPAATPASGCAQVGQQCAFVSPFNTPLAQCSGIGMTSGYLNAGAFAVVQGASFGSLQNNGDGTALLTRTGLGSIVVEVRATWIPNFTATSCVPIAPLQRRYDWSVL